MLSFLLVAKHCPKLPKPEAKVWDSYAVLDNPGHTFLPCPNPDSNVVPGGCPYIRKSLNAAATYSIQRVYKNKPLLMTLSHKITAIGKVKVDNKSI